MGALVLGIVAGSMISILVSILAFFIYDAIYERTIGKIVIVVAFTICTAVLILMPLATVNYDVNCYKSWTKEYQIQKETIESSIKSEKISGLERVRLLEMASQLNKELVQNQYRCQQWYGFTGDKEVLDLKPIKFD